MVGLGGFAVGDGARKERGLGDGERGDIDKDR